MIAGDSVVETLRLHKGDDGWQPDNEPSPEDLETAAKAIGRPLPTAWREVLAAGGGTVYAPNAIVAFFPARHVDKFNPAKQKGWPDLDGMILLGDDEGDFLYYFDPDDRLGYGAWAVFIVPKGSRTPASSIFAARDLRHLFERVFAGDDLKEGRLREDAPPR